MAACPFNAPRATGARLRTIVKGALFSGISGRASEIGRVDRAALDQGFREPRGGRRPGCPSITRYPPLHRRNRSEPQRAARDTDNKRLQYQSDTGGPTDT